MSVLEEVIKGCSGRPGTTDSEITGIIMINGPGVSTPEISYGLAADPSQEPTVAHQLTPLGQRQQYLIGTELRTRYTAPDYYPNFVLDPDYNVN